MLVLGALKRWSGATTERAKAACLLAAVAWAVLPRKAGSVAWISGRGDAMGLALLLAALAIRARIKVKKQAVRGSRDVRVTNPDGSTAVGLSTFEVR